MVIFMHVPKTAGTSLNAFIINSLQPKRELWIDHALELSFMSDETLGRYDYIATHCGFGMFDRFPANSPKITMLRNPIERVLSVYYSQRKLERSTPLRASAQDQSLEEFVEAPWVRIVIENAVTWQLCWDPEAYFRLKHSEVPEDELVARALKNLRSFDFVGIAEEFDRSADKLSRMFGWKAAKTEHQNRTVGRLKRDQHDDAVLQKIEQLVRLDWIIYEEAKRILASY